jgi:hypothetical protein
MSAEKIISMEPGLELNKLVSGSLNDGFTDMNDAWSLRDAFVAQMGGDFLIVRCCDEFPEHCSWDDGEGNKVLVWAKTGPEALTKTVALAIRELYGDFHPWTVFPQLKEEFTKQLTQLMQGKNS